jgi:hypothetical protein
MFDIQPMAVRKKSFGEHCSYYGGYHHPYHNVKISKKELRITTTLAAMQLLI